MAALVVAACGRIGFDLASAPDVMNDDAPAATFCGGRTTLCPSGAVFCDDLETSAGTTFPRWTDVALGNWAGGATDPSTSVTTSAIACSGSTAMHAHAATDAQFALLHYSLPARPNPLYVRAWLRIASTSPASNFEIMGVDSGTDFINVGVARGAQTISLNAIGMTAPVAGTSGPAALTADQWQCLELAIGFDTGSAGSVQVSLDGAQVLQVTGTTTDATTPLDQLYLGALIGNPAPGTFDVDFDDVVVSGQPIGCK